MVDACRKDVHAAGIPALCASCQARHKGICGALDQPQLAMLARVSSKQRYGTGKAFLCDAVAVERYANILSGVVKLTKALSDGRQQIVGLQFAPDFLGRPFRAESALTAEAATPVELCSFPRKYVERMMGEQPELEHRLFQQTLNELDEAREWLLMLGRKTASERVAGFLLLIARHIDPAAGPETGAMAFDLPLTRTEIADFLGLTIETVSRQFTLLRASRIIDIKNHRRVTIMDFKALSARGGD